MNQERRITLEAFTERFERLRDSIGRVVLGQEQVVEDMLIAVLARGHVLIEGAPGLGKTQLVKAFAGATDLEFGRIQFTPDLMPADISGTSIVLEDPTTGKREFSFKPGPIFSNIVIGVGIILVFAGSPFNLHATIWILLIAYFGVIEPALDDLSRFAVRIGPAADLTDLPAVLGHEAAGVVEAVLVCVPPAAEDVAVHGEVVVDDVEVPGRGEVVEGVVDPGQLAFAGAALYAQHFIIITLGHRFTIPSLQALLTFHSEPRRNVNRPIGPLQTATRE